MHIFVQLKDKIWECFFSFILLNLTFKYFLGKDKENAVFSHSLKKRVKQYFAALKALIHTHTHSAHRLPEPHNPTRHHPSILMLALKSRVLLWKAAEALWACPHSRVTLNVI